MPENDEEYTANVKKLQLMGFGNESQIKEALEYSNNDIDSAITYLVNVCLKDFHYIIKHCR